MKIGEVFISAVATAIFVVLSNHFPELFNIQTIILFGIIYLIIKEEENDE